MWQPAFEMVYCDDYAVAVINRKCCICKNCKSFRVKFKQLWILSCYNRTLSCIINSLSGLLCDPGWWCKSRLLCECKQSGAGMCYERREQYILNICCSLPPLLMFEPYFWEGFTISESTFHKRWQSSNLLVPVFWWRPMRIWQCEGWPIRGQDVRAKCSPNITSKMCQERSKHFTMGKF